MYRTMIFKQLLKEVRNGKESFHLMPKAERNEFVKGSYPKAMLRALS